MATAPADPVTSRTAEKRSFPYLARVLLLRDSSSGAASAQGPALSSHGGARLRADRTSDFLALHHARAIMLAAIAAEQVGEPFTRMVTIHWEKIGIPDHEAAAATGRLTKLAGDWARRRGGRVLWAWVRENGIGKGSHVHILLACPPHLPIGRRWRRWLRLITGRPYRAGAIDTQRIGGTLTAFARDPAAYRQNLFNVTAYVCKGVRPADAASLGLPRVEDGGRVTGKRSAVSPALLKLSR